MDNDPQCTGIQPSLPPAPPPIAPPGPALQPMPIQYQPLVPTQQPKPYIPVDPQQFRPVRIPSNYMPGLSGPRLPLHSSYALSASSGDQIQMNMDPTSQYQEIPNTNLASYPVWYPESWPSGSQVVQNVDIRQLSSSSGGQIQINMDPTSLYQAVPNTNLASYPVGCPESWPSGSQVVQNVNMALQSVGQNADADIRQATVSQPDPVDSDWSEHTTRDGNRYYYNRITRYSTWKKPLELMTPTERIEESTDWREYTAPNGLNFYYNKITKQSKWTIPDELKLARERLSIESTKGTPESIKVETFQFTPAVSPPEAKLFPLFAKGTAISVRELDFNPVLEKPFVPTVNLESMFPKVGQSNLLQESSSLITNQMPMESVAATEISTIVTTTSGADSVLAKDFVMATDGVSAENTEFLANKKREEAEKRGLKRKLAREDFKKMLEESKELTSASRWSKSIDIFEKDERYLAIERAKDREDLFGEYILELEKKERAKAAKEYRQKRMKYIEFLKSCDFITSRSQWRKVEDRLEVDEWCSQLDKIERFEIFTEYTRDLEKVEEEQRKLWLEEVRREERKNREKFRKLMEEHVASGKLTAKTSWHDFCMKVKDLPAYMAVASNTSGATPRDLFQDVAEELQKQLLEDKDRMKDAVKFEKITVSSTSTIEDLKTAISQHINTSPPVSEINLKIVFDELQEKAREREEQEAKRRKRQAEDFYNLLWDLKDTTASSKWEDCRAQLEHRQDVRLDKDESFFRDIFENYVTELKEKSKRQAQRRREEKEESERQKRKHRRDKERGKGKECLRKYETDIESDRPDESYSSDGNTKRSNRKDKDRKHRKHHRSSSSIVDHCAETTEDSESRKKRHKKDHRRDSGDKGREVAEDGKRI